MIDALAKKIHELTDASDLRFVSLDGSREMLNIARQRNNRIEWILGDMPGFRIDGTFDLAMSCYNTLQHVDSVGLAEAFRSIRSVLRPRGLFAFDIYQPNLAYLQKSQQNRLARSLNVEKGRLLEIRENSSYDAEVKLLILE
jgi:SAM-dependent methyltransferase